MRGYQRMASAMEQLRRESVALGKLSVLPLGGAHRVDEVMLCKDHLGHIHLVVERQAEAPKFTPAFGAVLETKWIAFDGETVAGHLDVMCSDPKLHDTFVSLVGEMLDRVDDGTGTALGELRRVVDDWHRALTRASKTISRQQLIGLFGELSVLEMLAKRDPVRALDSWRGKEGHRHDFALTHSVEVKTYTTLNSPSVSIHGAYQLDPPAGGNLHLLALRVEELNSGRTIAEVLESLSRLGVDTPSILGRSSDDSPIYLDDELRLLIAERRLFSVGDAFPGIRASQLTPLALTGVSHLQFDLILDACPGELDVSALDAVLDAL